MRNLVILPPLCLLYATHITLLNISTESIPRASRSTFHNAELVTAERRPVTREPLLALLQQNRHQAALHATPIPTTPPKNISGDTFRYRRDFAPCVVLRPQGEAKRDAEPFRKPHTPRLGERPVLLLAHVD